LVYLYSVEDVQDVTIVRHGGLVPVYMMCIVKYVRSYIVQLMNDERIEFK